MDDHALHELMHLNLTILEQHDILDHLIYCLDPLIHTGQPNLVVCIILNKLIIIGKLVYRYLLPYSEATKEIGKRNEK